MSEQKTRYISVKKAAEVLQLKRTSLYYYFDRLSIIPIRLETGQKKYISLEELERIKAAKEAANADER